MWLVLTLLGCLLLALVNILDKRIVSKAVEPAVFVFYSTIIALPIFLLLPFGVTILKSNFDWFVAVLSGLSFCVGLWFMYKSFASSEISHAGPLGGASITVATLILGSLFLHELLSFRQYSAIAFLLAGSILISFEKSKKHQGLHVGILWVIISGVFFAISNVAAKYMYDLYGFFSGLIWTKGFMGVGGLLLFLSPKIQKTIFKKQSRLSALFAPKPPFFLVASNKLMGVGGVLLLQYATVIGSVSLVNALTGAQYAFLIMLTAYFSKFHPKFIKEWYSKSEVLQEIVAVILICIGVILLV
jgi:drug/metabolite transporter (DMT)-like permease